MIPFYKKSSKITTENLKKFLYRKWGERAYLTDDAIDKSINCIIESVNKNAVFLSSVNIEIAMNKDMKNLHKKKNITEFESFVHIDKIVKTLKIDLKDNWETSIVPIHGGLHWSCLIYIRNPDITKFYHLDSIKGSNTGQCKNVVKLFEKYGLISGDYQLWEPNYFQQYSNWECGFYTILAAYIFLTRDVMEARRIWKESKDEEKRTLFIEMFDFFGNHEITYLKQ